MQLRLEVASRTETFKLDESYSYLLQGQLVFVADDFTEPHTMGQMSVPVSKETYEKYPGGTALMFVLDS